MPGGLHTPIREFLTISSCLCEHPPQTDGGSSSTRPSPCTETAKQDSKVRCRAPQAYAPSAESRRHLDARRLKRYVPLLLCTNEPWFVLKSSTGAPPAVNTTLGESDLPCNPEPLSATHASAPNSHTPTNLTCGPLSSTKCPAPSRNDATATMHTIRRICCACGVTMVAWWRRSQPHVLTWASR